MDAQIDEAEVAATPEIHTLLENIEVYSTLEKVPPGKVEIDASVHYLLSRPRITQHTPDWYHQRKLRVTASDIAAIVGANPYCSRAAIFKKKTGRGGNEFTNAACEWGLRLEDQAAKGYEAVTGIEVITEDIGLLVHETLDCIGASPDRVAKYFPLLIEIKCPFKREIKPGVIPKYYLPQVYTQLEVCNMPECHFVQYRPPSLCSKGIIDITVVKRDPVWWSTNLPLILSFWDEVVDYYKTAGASLGSQIPDTRKKRQRPVVVDLNDSYSACLFVGNAGANKYDELHPPTKSRELSPIHQNNDSVVPTPPPIYDIAIDTAVPLSATILTNCTPVAAAAGVE